MHCLLVDGHSINGLQVFHLECAVASPESLYRIRGFFCLEQRLVSFTEQLVQNSYVRVGPSIHVIFSLGLEISRGSQRLYLLDGL